VSSEAETGKKKKTGACLVLKNFQDFPSHRIFRRMYEALNINKK
jgi:hypothetical protein